MASYLMTRSGPSDFAQAKASAGAVLSLLAGVGLLCAGLPWVVPVDRLYQAGDAVGYSLGLAAAVLVVSLVPYSMRKRYAQLAALGSLSEWLNCHIVIGIGGSLLVLMHSRSRCASVIGGIALGSMMVVAISGVAGRFARRYIHGCLLESRVRLVEMEKLIGGPLSQASMAADIAAMLTRLRANTGSKSPARDRTVLQTINLHICGMTVRSRIGALFDGRHGAIGTDRTAESGREILEGLLMDYVRVVCEEGRLALWARALSSWHAVHFNAMVLFVIASLAHVVAVHRY